MGWVLTSFFMSSTYFTEGRTNLPRELDPIASRGGSVPAFIRKPIANCDFQGWGDPDPLPPPPSPELPNDIYECLIEIYNKA